MIRIPGSFGSNSSLVGELTLVLSVQACLFCTSRYFLPGDFQTECGPSSTLFGLLSFPCLKSKNISLKLIFDIDVFRQ